jgi:hypothetical protein
MDLDFSRYESGNGAPFIAILAIASLLAFTFLANNTSLFATTLTADSSVRLLAFQLGQTSFASISASGDCSNAKGQASGQYLYVSSLSKEGLSASKDFRVSTADGSKHYWTDRFWYLFDSNQILAQVDGCLVSVPFDGQEIEYSPPANRWNPKQLRIDTTPRTLTTGQQVAGAAYLDEPYSTANLHYSQGVEWMVPWRSRGGGNFFITDLDGDLSRRDVLYRQISKTTIAGDQFLGATCTKMFGIYDLYAYFWVPAPASYNCQ